MKLNYYTIGRILTWVKRAFELCSDESFWDINNVPREAQPAVRKAMCDVSGDPFLNYFCTDVERKYNALVYNANYTLRITIATNDGELDVMTSPEYITLSIVAADISIEGVNDGNTSMLYSIANHVIIVLNKELLNVSMPKKAVKAIWFMVSDIILGLSDNDALDYTDVAICNWFVRNLLNLDAKVFEGKTMSQLIEEKDDPIIIDAIDELNLASNIENPSEALKQLKYTFEDDTDEMWNDLARAIRKRVNGEDE